MELPAGGSRAIDCTGRSRRPLAVEFSEIWMEPGPLSGRTSLVTGPTGRIPAYTDAALARLADGLRQPLTQRADSHDDRGYSERCLRFVTGGPPMMAFPFAPLVQIVQTPDHVVIQTEENHESASLETADVTASALAGDSADAGGRHLVVETTNSRQGRVAGSVSSVRVRELTAILLHGPVESTPTIRDRTEPGPPEPKVSPRLLRAGLHEGTTPCSS